MTGAPRPSLPRFTHISLVAALTLVFAASANAASWKGIEPLKSRRADVVRLLGQPASENAADASMRFATSQFEAIVSMVTRAFAARKGWPPALEGTVLQILLQHHATNETPKSLGVEGNPRYHREVRGESAFYRNRKDGIIRVFTGGKLTTTIFSPADGGPAPND